MTVCVFAASSSRTDGEYSKAASRLGTLLAQQHIDIVYGGGGIGLMGKLADAALQAGGKITGVIPAFMKEEGWGHHGISEMIVTTDMNERKKKMFELSDAVVALPGGIGTLEELTEAITLKQLSLFHGRVIILNTLGYYDSFLKFIDDMVKGNFFRHEHRGIWQVASTPEEALSMITREQKDSEEWRKTAKI
ncbi:MAG TPA: TIGR00730 family Rossman fold protein [Bacteroidales bacterium]|nr:TIGR00730 family Rossman fold protein [Bacteroidales bacterium]HPF02101.1 TIGR00730 family Rossman fold protein [Bacteroidales bacterium]HPJ59112.1 TIGR00730 family Rossman fold protein [Bacteroidales bacterium]HPR11411.1 TIGR00730 family Rossman fold protein [Bacteroidales bacterium]HRW85273.1 TIGR00730 family Rossman fold protein [Bacteroidales bacterium]